MLSPTAPAHFPSVVTTMISEARPVELGPMLLLSLQEEKAIATSNTKSEFLIQFTIKLLKQYILIILSGANKLTLQVE